MESAICLVKNRLVHAVKVKGGSLDQMQTNETNSEPQPETQVAPTHGWESFASKKDRKKKKNGIPHLRRKSNTRDQYMLKALMSGNGIGLDVYSSLETRP
jgi:hypothetical protein